MIQFILAATLSLGSAADANRVAIQRAVDEAAAKGGGKVAIPAGTWPTGSIELKSGVELHLEKGATLKGSTKPSDYNADDVFPENFHSVGEEWSGGHLVYGYKAENVAITGEGVIDGSGPDFFGEVEITGWFPWYKYGLKLHPIDRSWFRPGPMVAFFLSRNIRFEDVTLANTPCWTVHIRCCDGFKARGVKILADRTIANSDGFSIDCTRNVEIERCTVKTGDDSFAIRASCRHHAETNVCEHIRVRDCDVSSCCFAVRLGIGSGTIRDVVFEDCRLHESALGVGFTPAWVRGARNVYIEDCTFRRCAIGECERPVKTQVPDTDTRVRGIRFEDCTFESLFPAWVDGSAATKVEDFSFVRCARKAIWRTKAYFDERWNGECWKRIRRQADVFAEIGTNTVKVTTTDCKPGPVSRRGVMLLSFDDQNFDGWIAALPVFEKYGAHATFFVSGAIDDTVVRKMKTLTAKGHAIGLHGLDHRNAPEAIGQLGEEGYYAADIEVPKRKCDVAYVYVTSFAYPNCRFDDRSDALFFRKGFAHVRGGIKGLRPYDPNGEKKGTLKPLVTDERMFFPASELPKRRRLDTVLLGEAYNTDIADYLACIRRAAERDEVLVLASHNIAPNARGINMKTEWLEALLAEAQKCGMKVISYNELPPLDED